MVIFIMVNGRLDPETPFKNDLMAFKYDIFTLYIMTVYKVDFHPLSALKVIATLDRAESCVTLKT